MVSGASRFTGDLLKAPYSHRLLLSASTSVALCDVYSSSASSDVIACGAVGFSSQHW